MLLNCCSIYKGIKQNVKRKVLKRIPTVGAALIYKMIKRNNCVCIIFFCINYSSEIRATDQNVLYNIRMISFKTPTSETNLIKGSLSNLFKM